MSAVLTKNSNRPRGTPGPFVAKTTWRPLFEVDLYDQGTLSAAIDGMLVQLGRQLLKSNQGTLHLEPLDAQEAHQLLTKLKGVRQMNPRVLHYAFEQQLVQEFERTALLNGITAGYVAQEVWLAPAPNGAWRLADYLRICG